MASSGSGEGELEEQRQWVLVVDDDGVRSILHRILVRRGYQVVSVADAREAHEAVGARPFDLAIVDVVLGHADGREVARALAAQRAGLRILHVSGDAAATTSAAVPTAFVAKPFTPAELVAAVERALALPF